MKLYGTCGVIEVSVEVVKACFSLFSLSFSFFVCLEKIFAKKGTSCYLSVGLKVEVVVCVASIAPWSCTGSLHWLEDFEKNGPVKAFA